MNRNIGFSNHSAQRQTYSFPGVSMHFNIDTCVKKIREPCDEHIYREQSTWLICMPVGTHQYVPNNIVHQQVVLVYTMKQLEQLKAGVTSGCIYATHNLRTCVGVDLYTSSLLPACVCAYTINMCAHKLKPANIKVLQCLYGNVMYFTAY